LRIQQKPRTLRQKGAQTARKADRDLDATLFAALFEDATPSREGYRVDGERKSATHRLMPFKRLWRVTGARLFLLRRAG
jgi:hypothetical protein